MAGIPIGFYFNPTDTDLLHHLRLKISGKSQQYGLIWDREIYQDEMPCEFFVGDSAKEEELYFFTTLKNKFENGNADRKDRVVGNGYWRTQRTRKVLDDDHDCLLGFKTFLNFFEKGTKTGSKWIMHEYTLPAGEQQQQLWAVCRIKRARKSADSSPASSSSPSSSGPVKRKATPLDHDHHNKRPHFSHPQSQVAPTTQSPVSPPDIAASPLDDDHSERVCHDTPEAVAYEADFFPTDLSMEDIWDSYSATLTEYIDLTLPPDGHDIAAAAVSPLDDDHSERVCHDIPDDDDHSERVCIDIPDDDDDHSERVCIDIPDDDDDDDDDEVARFIETLTMEDDFLDSDVAALTSEPPTADHQEMIPPADYHAAAILDPPQATSTHAEFGETEYLPAEFSIDECD